MAKVVEGMPLTNDKQTPRPAREGAAEAFRLLVESVKDYAIFILDPRRIRRDLEPRRRAHQGLPRRRDHRQALLDLLSARGRRRRQVRARARDRRAARGASRKRAGASARTARASGPTSPSPRCAIPSGTLVGFAKVTRDLTERRVAEEEARRFRLLVESVKDYAIFILDPSGHVDDLERRRRAHQGLHAPTRSSASTSRSSTRPRTSPPASRERELEIADARGALRGGGLARPQGRLALVGQRHHHRAAQPRGRR